MITKNLTYNKEKKRLFIHYLWKCERSVLPRNEAAAMKLMLSIDRSEQIQDTLDRGIAIVLLKEEVKNWKGHYHYLAPVAAKGKKSMRLCWDTARRQGVHPSTNDCLYKGLDCFINNLLSVILDFRNGRVGCVADIKKFHSQVHLFPEDIHMQPFPGGG